MKMTRRQSLFEQAYYATEAASTVGEAIVSLSKIYNIDFVTYHFAQTIIDSVDSPFVRTNYPDEWVSRYLLNGYVKVDPIVKEGFLRQLPFHWREIEIPPDAYDFFQDAQRHGIGENGFSIPIVDKVRRRALLSMNSMKAPSIWNRTVNRHKEEWVELALLVHQKAVLELYGERDPAPSLSPRELECLHWTALGKGYKEIALILGISDHTARSYLKSARIKLGCVTISSAATLALHLRLITL
ncbi:MULTISPECIES: helix-turn-helix transcriptional regulator [Pseudochelatococcus]|nr:LuxR family transcriptional regulator [Pseudochelatococcus contaminans]